MWGKERQRRENMHVQWNAFHTVVQHHIVLSKNYDVKDQQQLFLYPYIVYVHAMCVLYCSTYVMKWTT